MRLARILYIVIALALALLSVASITHVGRNRLSMNRTCELYRLWLALADNQPIDDMQFKCGDVWRAYLGRKTEWEMP